MRGSSAGSTKKRALPKRGRPKGSTSDATRARILRAAWACFGARGYGETTNRDIAERAGITSAAIYVYFDSKTDLYFEAVRAAYEKIHPHFEAAAAGAKSARGGLVALVRSCATALDVEPGVAPFLSAIPVEMQRHPEIAERMKAERHAFLDLTISMATRGVDSGELAPEQAAGVVSMLISCSMGLSLYAALLGREGFERAVEAFARTLEGRLFVTERR